MRLPKEIKIGDRVHKIKVVDKSEVGVGGSASVTSFNNYNILIDEDLSDDKIVNALWYEIISAILDYDVDMTKYDEFGGNEKPVIDLAETLVKMLKENDFSFMRDNPAKLRSDAVSFREGFRSIVEYLGDSNNDPTGDLTIDKLSK